MKKTIDILFENKLVNEKRDMNVYHRGTRGTHFISHGGSVTISLQTLNKEDYINLSVATGPGYMERRNIVDLPSWLNYEFLSEGKFGANHSGNRTLLKIPAGLPEWKLKLTLPAAHLNPSASRVTISDDQDE
jgi:hypothetical protein